MLRYGSLSRRPRGVDPRSLVFAVVDTETTGLTPQAGDRVCELAVLRIRGDGEVLDEYATLIDPGRPMRGTQWHGLTDTDVAGAPRFPDVAGELLARLSGAVLVAHNLSFDGRMLAAELARARAVPAYLPGLCTLAEARAQLDLPGYGLGPLLAALTGSPPDRTHAALADARWCAQVLIELIAGAPGPLRYSGPPIRELRVPPWLRAIRRPRPRPEPPVAWHLTARRLAAVPWRPLELDARHCRGPFRGDDRAAALRVARRRSRWRALLPLPGL